MKFLSHILIILTLLLVFGGSLFAQQRLDHPEMQEIFRHFGDISISELDMEPEHDYPYEYLMKKSAVRFREERGSIEAVIDHYVRIKIHTDDPLEKAEAAMVAIPYYYADNMEQIINLRGTTHHPNGSYWLLRSADATRSDLNTRYRILEFEMPEVVQGSVIEYKYTVIRRYIEELPDFYFSHRVPVRKASVRLQNEEFLRYNVIKENPDFEIEYSEVRIDTSSIPPVFTYERPEPIYIQRWDAEHIPAAELSAYISSVEDVRGKLKFQINEFGLPRQPLENSWEYVAAQIRRNSNPEILLEYHPELYRKGKEIAEQLNSREAIQDSVFSYVNSRKQYNGMNAVFAERGFLHVTDGQPADQAEINMALLAMLRGAGIESYPLYISGREFGRINEAFPSLYQFNRMLVHSRIDGEEYVMDGSFSHSYPNLIPVESYNEQGFLLKPDNYEWVEVSPAQSMFELSIVVDAELNRKGTLTGSLRAETSGYPAQQVLQEIGEGRTVSEVVRSTFFDVYDDGILRSPKVSDKELRTVYVETGFEIENYARSFTDALEMRPMIVGYLFRNPFEQSERRVPITLDAPESLTIRYSLRLPQGAMIEELNETFSTRMPGAELAESYRISGREVSYTFEIDITRREFPAESYNDLRRIYERWVELSNDTWFVEF